MLDFNPYFLFELTLNKISIAQTVEHDTIRHGWRFDCRECMEIFYTLTKNYTKPDTETVHFQKDTILYLNYPQRVHINNTLKINTVNYILLPDICT